MRRRAVEYGIRPAQAPVSTVVEDENGIRERVYRQPQRDGAQVTDEQLDEMMKEVLTIFPEIGRAMIRGALMAWGVRASRERIRESFVRVNGAPAEFGRPPIQRRCYYVPGPNSLWHHDGYHSKSFEPSTHVQ